MAVYQVIVSGKLPSAFSTVPVIGQWTVSVMMIMMMMMMPMMMMIL